MRPEKPKPAIAQTGLSERSIRTIKEILEKYSDVREVVLFGSRAKGTFHAGSDVDLAVMNPGISEKTISRILSELEESSLPVRVDLVDFNSIANGAFIDHIRRIGILFYKKDGAAGSSDLT